MTTYTVHFHNDAAWASRDFKAATPQKALIRARKALDEGSLDLCFMPDDIPADVNEILVNDDDGNERAVWYDDTRRVYRAAHDLLAGLKQAVAALNMAPRFAVPSLDTDSYRIAALCERAIAKAKGGAA